jgi:hypothetical protein
MLMELLGKNTVLIVEFAIQNAAGKSVLEAAMEGAKKRVSSYSNDIVCFYSRFATISVCYWSR